ncbi:Cholinephosphotransferase 1 [Seminavis robusta]|uniref:Cholinephosphotransferase 1 n=1 Tax=Seminavis robusta TaxID=568900 RepID=A0A9N8DS77_9STRA|nr:Cholinephosphotransferase 1 [Seminavis robusta]|eukprot:Sro244_g097270.1 Cholinephosphotransferase 1 (266) ;mRNA; r:74481-75366
MTTSYFYDYVLSPFYDWLSPLIWPDWVHPNAITLIGGYYAILSSYCVLHSQLGWACLFFTMYHMCDNMDGKHARRTGKTSKFGGILDHWVDGAMGNIAAYISVVRFAFGKTPADDVYWQGLHGYYCLWLAPHVVAHFSGTLALGTKFFSIDEAAILATMILFYAWVSEGDIVLLKDDWYSYGAAWAFQVLSLLYGTLLSAYHWFQATKETTEQKQSAKSTVWNHISFMLFIQFWLHGVCFGYSDFFHFYLRWIPVMSVIIFTQED